MEPRRICQKNPCVFLGTSLGGSGDDASDDAGWGWIWRWRLLIIDNDHVRSGRVEGEKKGEEEKGRATARAQSRSSRRALARWQCAARRTERGFPRPVTATECRHFAQRLTWWSITVEALPGPAVRRGWALGG